MKQLELFEDPIPENVRLTGYTFIESDQVSLYYNAKLISVHKSYTDAYKEYKRLNEEKK